MSTPKNKSSWATDDSPFTSPPQQQFLEAANEKTPQSDSKYGLKAYGNQQFAPGEKSKNKGSFPTRRSGTTQYSLNNLVANSRATTQNSTLISNGQTVKVKVVPGQSLSTNPLRIDVPLSRNESANPRSRVGSSNEPSQLLMVGKTNNSSNLSQTSQALKFLHTAHNGLPISTLTSSATKNMPVQSNESRKKPFVDPSYGNNRNNTTNQRSNNSINSIQQSNNRNIGNNGNNNNNGNNGNNRAKAKLKDDDPEFRPNGSKAGGGAMMSTNRGGKKKQAPEVIDLADDDEVEQVNGPANKPPHHINDLKGLSGKENLSALHRDSHLEPYEIAVGVDTVYLGMLPFSSCMRRLRCLFNEHGAVFKLPSTHEDIKTVLSSAHEDMKTMLDNLISVDGAALVLSETPETQETLSATDSSDKMEVDAEVEVVQQPAAVVVEQQQKTAEKAAGRDDSLVEYEDECIPLQFIKSIACGTILPTPSTSPSSQQGSAAEDSAAAATPVTPDEEAEAFISFTLLEDTPAWVFKRVALGANNALDPAGKNTKKRPSKFVLLVTTKKDMENFVKKALKYETLKAKLTDRTIKDFSANPIGPYPLSNPQLFAHAHRADFDQAVLRSDVLIQLEALKNKPAAADALGSRRSTRNNRSATGAWDVWEEPEVVDPNDCIVHLVYPTHIDATDAITIHRGDLKRLRPGEYLNDNLIDLRIKHLLSQLSEERRSKVHAFSCLFYAKLTERKGAPAHNLVSRWTKSVDLFAMDFVIIPINLAFHWSVCVLVRPGELLRKMDAYLTDCNQPGSDGKAKSPAPKKTGGKGKENLKNKVNSSPSDSVSISSGGRLRKNSSAARVVELADDSDLSGEVGPASSSMPMETGGSADSKVPPEDVSATPLPPQEPDECCLLFMDSLSMHPTGTIATAVKSYLFYEWESRYREKREKACQERIQQEGAQEGGSQGDKCAATSYIGEEALKVFKQSLQHIKANKIPKQENGFDCGVYVIKYAQMLLDTWPRSTADDLRDGFVEQFVGRQFSQKDVNAERKSLLKMLETTSVEWNKVREQYRQEHPDEADPFADALATKYQASQDSSVLCVTENPRSNSDAACDQGNMVGDAVAMEEAEAEEGSVEMEVEPSSSTSRQKQQFDWLSDICGEIDADVRLDSSDSSESSCESKAKLRTEASESLPDLHRVDGQEQQGSGSQVGESNMDDEECGEGAIVSKQLDLDFSTVDRSDAHSSSSSGTSSSNNSNRKRVHSGDSKDAGNISSDSSDSDSEEAEKGEVVEINSSGGSTESLSKQDFSSKQLAKIAKQQRKKERRKKQKTAHEVSEVQLSPQTGFMGVVSGVVSAITTILSPRSANRKEVKELGSADSKISKESESPSCREDDVLPEGSKVRQTMIHSSSRKGNSSQSSR